MSISGYDLFVDIPPGVPATELILERVRRLWPDACYQSVDDDHCRAIHDPWVLVRGGRSREFLLYQDRRAYKSWDRWGATKKNLTTMLYFLIGPSPSGAVDTQQLTVVCGEKTGEVERFVSDLQMSFRNSQFSVA